MACFNYRPVERAHREGALAAIASSDSRMLIHAVSQRWLRFIPKAAFAERKCCSIHVGRDIVLRNLAHTLCHVLIKPYLELGFDRSGGDTVGLGGRAKEPSADGICAACSFMLQIAVAASGCVFGTKDGRAFILVSHMANVFALDRVDCARGLSPSGFVHRSWQVGSSKENVRF